MLLMMFYQTKLFYHVCLIGVMVGHRLRGY
jgi:hypothetical protein